MDNASKALLIVGSILIAIMILAIALYIFRSGQEFTVSVTSTTDDSVIASFNANFLVYETDPDFTTVDETTRFKASSELNTIADVVTCINFAFTVNDENNYSYKYVNSYGLEETNAVEVYIDMQNYSGDDLDNYYLIEPNADVESGYVYGFSSLGSTRANRLSSTKNGFTRDNAVSCNKLLELLNTSKLVESSGKKYTLYQYYFGCKLEYDDTTDKINSVQFTLICDSGFDSL